MVSKTTAVIPHDLTVEDWRGLLSTFPNALLIGPSEAAARIIEALLPQLQPPVCRCTGTALALPQHTRGTLIIEDVAALSMAEQERLLGWLLEPDRLTQVVATSASAVFPRVVNGVFLDVLYYRLNVMSFTLAGTGHSA